MCYLPQAVAHQTPSTIVLLDVSPSKVAVELQLPLGELELAFGQELTKNPETLIERVGPQLKEYLLAHIHAMTAKDQPWWVVVTDMKVEKAEQTASGPFQEITVHLILTPPAGISTRKFILDYDVIMHQLVTHNALVSIRNDWELGKAGEQPLEVGVIRVDTKTTLIYPLVINLEKGSWWKGFSSMVSMGKQHIAEGTDHLLFLLVLLLPAPLLVGRRRWGAFGGLKYSLLRLLKIVTAFTIGHSVTLMAGALGWFVFPSRPVEIVIALSIVVSAVHAFWPIFSGKEAYVAAGFGLIHGMAFAGTLVNLHLDIYHLGISILGFNLGIELMQLVVIAMVFPWLIILSRKEVYSSIRIAGATLSAIAAFGWMLERITENSNPVTSFTEHVVGYAPWLVLILAVGALLSLLINAVTKLSTAQ